MPRTRPASEHTCHICGTCYTISPEYDGDDGGERVRAVPARCPCRDAEERHAPVKPRHAGQMLVATHAGSGWHERQFGSAQQFLHTTSRTPADVDACLAQVAQLDFAAWQHDLEAALHTAADAAGRRELRDELRAARRAARAAARGSLLPELRRIGEAVRERLEQERAHHLALYAQRSADGLPPRAAAHDITGETRAQATPVEVIVSPDAEIDHVPPSTLLQ